MSESDIAFSERDRHRQAACRDLESAAARIGAAIRRLNADGDLYPSLAVVDARQGAIDAVNGYAHAEAYTYARAEAYAALCEVSFPDKPADVSEVQS